LTKIGQEKNSVPGSIGSVLWGSDMLLDILEETRKKYKIEKPDNKKDNKKLSHSATCINHARGTLLKVLQVN
jgi:hypothetical protein